MSARSSRRTSVTIRNIRLTALFKPEDVLHHTDARSREEVIRELLEHLALQYGIGNVNKATEAVMESATKGDVHSGQNMVVLRGRLEAITDLRVAVATSEKGIPFGDQSVNLVILVLSPIDMPGAYTHIMQGIDKIFERDDAALSISRLQTPLAVWQHFESGGHRLPDYLEARHVMTDVTVFLNSNDNMAKAIDLFLAHSVSELPVLAPDRELIGVVTTKQLVRVCLPDYLMWMEDMTPFLNFEPLAEIIRNESSTWLWDIMISDYAQVAEDSPAILAMKEIGRRQSANAYVLRDRKLVGIIRLREFLKCVLR